MNKKAKIFSIVLGVIVVSGIVLYSGSAELFQGRMFSNLKPLSAYNENRCYDSDGGKHYEEKGTIYGKITRSDYGNKTDECTTRTKVKEYYCNGKFIKSEEYNCESGCSKGACKLPLCEGEICDDWGKIKTISTLDNIYKLFLVNENMVSIVSVVNNPDESGISVSFDQGQSWNKKVSGIINNIVYDDEANLLYAVGAVPNGDGFFGILYKSVDFGQTWNELASFPHSARNILVDKDDSKKLYVLTQQNDFEFYVSENAGQDWVPMTFNYFPEEFIPWAVAQNGEYIELGGYLSNDNGNVIAAYDGQVFFGSVGGNVYKVNMDSPSTVKFVLENLGSVVSDIDFNNGKMYITTFSDGILVFEKK